ncbi:N-formylglutamate amidohydrolase [Rhodopirellula sp. JC740]|uniref:N-formylglutamate amidohydrolase n=1 Tax=Rhodopirellula halodulae TaxID=2894198 RepID=A0ABS8NDB9_9BACT|nr:N-formylglutamate amidohydrolase [Rhodopirellula sp. JC740]MCC9640828.1 N-formylglutamate amidohydrolase [Rhodopirellula sp. JC740]
MALLVTCDTGGDRIPETLREPLAHTPFFSDVLHPPQPPAQPARRDRLEIPRLDREAGFAARAIAEAVDCDLIANPYRADLVDVGRSIHHRNLFRPEVRCLPTATRKAILAAVRTPYRDAIRRRLSDLLLRFPYVVHLSIRTFAARTKSGGWQRGDVGLLYDPSRGDELDWCLDLSDELYFAMPDLKVRRNHPGRGTNDSLTKAMRKHFSDVHYLGIEVVLNRAWVARPVRKRREVLRTIGNAIREVTPEATPQAA